MIPCSFDHLYFAAGPSFTNVRLLCSVKVWSYVVSFLLGSLLKPNRFWADSIRSNTGNRREKPVTNRR
jgi:hypothetical protein